MQAEKVRMTLAWLILGAAGLGVGGFVVAIVGPNPAAFSSPHTVLFGLWAMLGAVIGAMVGAAQWLALRRYAQVSRWWVLSDVAAWAIAMPIAGAIETPMETDFGLVVYSIDGAVSNWLLVGAVVGVVASCVQAIVLSLHDRRAFLWISLNTIGWALALGAGWVAAVDTLCIVVGPIGFFSGLLGHAFSGLPLLLQVPEHPRQRRQSLPASSGKSAHSRTSISYANAAVGRMTSPPPNRCADLFYRDRTDSTSGSFSTDELSEMLTTVQRQIESAITNLGEDEMERRPYAGANSALDIMAHLVETELPGPRPATKDEALGSLQRADAEMKEYLTWSLDPEQRVTWWDGEEIPITSAVWGAIRHRSYHLNELVRLQQAMSGNKLRNAANQPPASQAEEPGEGS
jgi:hypothetical protein